MGMDAEIIAIGKFSKRIVSCLEYPEDYYSDVEEGATVITILFYCVTSDQSRQLAKAFGVDPWALGNHHLDPLLFDPLKLDDYCWDREDCIKQFYTLKDAGFDFYYRPNG